MCTVETRGLHQSKDKVRQKKKAWGVSHCPRDSQCQSEGGRRENGGQLSWIHISECQPALSAPPASRAATARYPCFRVRRFTVFSSDQVQKPCKSTVS